MLAFDAKNEFDRPRGKGIVLSSNYVRGNLDRRQGRNNSVSD